MGLPDTSRGSWVKDPLKHYVAVNYKVPPERVRALVAPQVELDTRRDAEGTEWAFVSVLLFDNVDFRFPFLPWGFKFLQNNYRVYIRHQGQPGVWLFKIVQGTRLASLTRTLMKSPTYQSTMRLETDYDEAANYYRYLRFHSETPGCQLHMDISSEGGLPQDDAMFTAQEQVHFFTQPVLGFYFEVGSRNISTLAVSHAPIQPRLGRMLQASAEVFTEFGVMLPDEVAQPYSILMEADIPDFIGQMPKRRVQL